MSHVAGYKTEITNVDPSLLAGAFNAVAQAEGGTLGAEVFDWVGENGQAVLVSLKCPAIPHGIGVRIENGVLEFVGDPYCVRDWGRVRQLILSNYTAFGYINAVQAAELSDVTVEDTAEEIVINAYE